MIIIVDERVEVTEAYCASLGREGLSTTGFNHIEFDGWFHSAGLHDLAAVETIIIGSFPDRERAISSGKIALEHSGYRGQRNNGFGIHAEPVFDGRR